MLKKTSKKIYTIALLSLLATTSFCGVAIYFAKSLKTTYETQNVAKDPEMGNAVLDSTIKNLEIPASFNSLQANQYYQSLNISTLLSDYSTALKSESLANVISQIQSVNSNFKLSDLENDILYYLKNLYSQNNNFIGIQIKNHSFSISSSSISFDYQITLVNTSVATIAYTIDDKQFFISPNQTLNVEISANNQPFYFYVDLAFNDFYLDWNTNVSFKVANNSFVINNFSFTKNNYSIGIKTKLNGIKDSLSYQEISNNQDYYQNINESFLNQEIASYFQTNMDSSLNLIHFIAPIINGLKTNQTINYFLQSQQSNLSGLILELLQIDKSDTNYNGYLQLFQQLIANQLPLINIVSSNLDAISNLIAFFIKDTTITPDVIKTYIEKISPSLSDSQLKTQANDLKGLITYFIESSNLNNVDLNFINGMVDTIFNRTYTTLDLLNYLFSDKNSNALVQMITTNEEQQNTFLVYFQFLNTFFKDPSQFTLSTLTSSQGVSALKNVIQILMGNSPVQERDKNSLLFVLVDQIFDVNNTNLNELNLANLISKLIGPLCDFLANQDNYKLSYQTKSFAFDKSTNKVSYQYLINFEFTNSFTIDFEPLLEILPNVLQIENTAIPKSVLSYILNQDNQMLSGTIGKGDNISFSFDATNSPIYLVPKLSNDGKYYASYAIEYHMNLKMNLNSFYNSITSFYKTSSTSTSHIINDKIVAILIQFLQDYMLRDYDFYGMINLVDPSTIIDNYNQNTYYANNFFKWKKPDNAFYESLKANLTNIDNNQFSLNTTADTDSGVQTDSKQVYGQKPEFINGFEKTLENNLFEYKSDFAPIIKITPTINSAIPISFIGVTLASINVISIQVQVWFPYGVVDLTNPDAISFNNYFQTVIMLN
ncbi:MAG: hypothetical protein HUJ42_02845 [Malacoplasma sp.]|nr:hypothetical protein [Malacoplasma sp.]